MVKNNPIRTILNSQKPSWFILVDPEKWKISQIPKFVEICCENGVDAILIGGSTLEIRQFDEFVKIVKSHSSVPIVLFPGSFLQLSNYADALLFLSLLSGRNPQYLIGEQVLAAPKIAKMSLEIISTGYLLIDGGTKTATARVSATNPLAQDLTDDIVAHALAGKYLGMDTIYLEAGSGAKNPISDATIKRVKNATNLPIIVGGGIKTPEIALEKAKSGANAIVTGNVFESDFDDVLMREFADAIHHL